MAKLIQFTVGNYRSFNIERTFTFTPILLENKVNDSIIQKNGYCFSTISAIYGANSSGKSNLTEALAMMIFLVRHSVKLNDNDELIYDPFMLSSVNSDDKPTRFEIVYLNNRYEQIRYGFEYNSSRISKEWLFHKTSIEEVPLFLRDSEGIAVNEDCFCEGIDCEEKTNDNRLFLSLVAQLGGNISKDIMSFFQVDCNVISGLDHRGYSAFTKHQFKIHDAISDNAMQFFTKLQLGFTGIDIEEAEIDLSKIPVELRPSKKPTKLEVYSFHNIYDAYGNISGTYKFQFTDNESSGSQKLFELAGPIFDTLKCGGILVIDELDAKMHPLISHQLVMLFINKKSNPLNAQLLFTTHDTNLLSSNLLRADQIWFTEKDKCEATDLYRLTDVIHIDGSKINHEVNLEQNYIKGRYGAIPFITSNLDC